jgi:hypothetical protein
LKIEHRLAAMNGGQAHTDPNQIIEEGGLLAESLSRIRLLFWESKVVVVGSIAKLLVSGSLGAFFIGIARWVFHREAVDAAGGAVLFGFLLSILSYVASYAALLSHQEGDAAELHSKLLQTILATVTTSLMIFTVSYLVVGGRLLQKLYEWIDPLNLNSGLSVWLAMTAYGLAAVVLIGLITEWNEKITVQRSLKLLIWCAFYIVICASVLKFAVVDPPISMFP